MGIRTMRELIDLINNGQMSVELANELIDLDSIKLNQYRRPIERHRTKEGYTLVKDLNGIRYEIPNDRLNEFYHYIDSAEASPSQDEFNHWRREIERNFIQFSI